MEDEKRIEIWNQELDTGGLELEVKIEERSIIRWEEDEEMGGGRMVEKNKKEDEERGY